MARQSNILTFDEVKRSSRKRTQTEGTSSSRARSQRRSSSTRAGRSYEEEETAKRTRSRSASKDSERLSERSTAKSSSKKRTTKESSAKAKSKSLDFSKTSSARGKSTETRKPKHSASAAEERKKKRAKAKADKMFDRQFASSSSSAPEEGAPRAALYKGEMDATQRRATKMEKSSEAGSWSAKINPAGWFSNINITPGRARAITVIVCLVLACLFLYTPAQQYYQSVRAHDKLEAEYAAIYDRNVALDRQNDTLASDAGMEDAVRSRYGYVVEGEEVARVSGLSETALAREGNDDIEASVLSVSVKAPEYWYTPFLDALFGVS